MKAWPSLGGGRLALCLVLAWTCVGCASTGLGDLFTGGGGSKTAEMWEVPEEAYPTQRLYRMRYRGPEDERAGFKLTLYLVGQAQYRMLAADSLGRKLWSLDLDAEGRATWLNYREKEFCHLGAADSLGFLPIARLPMVALPRLLLGRMPTEPRASLEKYETHLTFLDVEGQRWNGSFQDGELQWWSQVEGEENIAWWRREEQGGSYIHRSSQQELRWKEIVREPMTAPLGALDIPERFREGICTIDDV